MDCRKGNTVRMYEHSLMQSLQQGLGKSRLYGTLPSAHSVSVFWLVGDLNPLQLIYSVTIGDVLFPLIFAYAASYDEEFHKSFICAKN